MLRPTIIAHGKWKAAATTNEPLLPHCYLGHNQGVVVAYPPPTLSYAMTASFLPHRLSTNFFIAIITCLILFFPTLSQLTIYYSLRPVKNAIQKFKIFQKNAKVLQTGCLYELAIARLATARLQPPHACMSLLIIKKNPA